LHGCLVKIPVYASVFMHLSLKLSLHGANYAKPKVRLRLDGRDAQDMVKEWTFGKGGGLWEERE